MVLILDPTEYPNGYGYAKIRIQNPKCYDRIFAYPSRKEETRLRFEMSLNFLQMRFL